MGFHSNILLWIKSYLSDRKYYVSIDGYSSMPFTAASGIPQGSVLGPLFFNLFINDISSCTSYSQCLLYADDMKLFKCISNQFDASLLQIDIFSITRWCEMNCLFLNSEKCFHVSYGRLRCPILTEYYISGRLCKQVHEILDLGVVFDSKLNFNAHIDYIIPHAYSVLAFIKRHSIEFVDPYVRKILYTSFVRSKLEYAQIVWNPSASTQINRVERVQKKFIKFALVSLHFNQPMPTYESRCRLIRLPLLYKRRSLQSIMFIYKIICGFIDSPYLLNLISFNVPSRRLRHFEFFHLPCHRTNYCMNEPILRTLREFNYICSLHDIDFSFNLTEFKKLLELIYY